MRNQDYVCTYLDNLLTMTRDPFNEHWPTGRVFLQIRKVGLHISTAKYNFAHEKIEYLGYILTREDRGYQASTWKGLSFLALKPPQFVKELSKFLGTIQYYCELWGNCSHLLLLLTDWEQVWWDQSYTQELDQTRPWYWNNKHQEAFKGIKSVIARDILLATMMVLRCTRMHLINRWMMQSHREASLWPFSHHNLSKPQTK